MKISEMHDRLFNEIMEYKKEEMSKSQDDMYNDVYSIYAHQYIYDFLSEYLRDFSLSFLSEKRNIIEYIFDSYVSSDYQLNDEDLRDLIYELIEDEQRKLACNLTFKIYQKLNKELEEYKDSFTGATPDEIFEQSEKIHFFNKMNSCFENFALKYQEAKFLINNENNTILSDIFEFANSSEFEYDKKNYNEILTMYFIKNDVHCYYYGEDWEDDESEEEDSYQDKTKQEDLEQE